jgi:hypothetical protein
MIWRRSALCFGVWGVGRGVGWLVGEGEGGVLGWLVGWLDGWLVGHACNVCDDATVGDLMRPPLLVALQPPSDPSPVSPAPSKNPPGAPPPAPPCGRWPRSAGPPRPQPCVWVFVVCYVLGVGGTTFK